MSGRNRKKDEERSRFVEALKETEGTGWTLRGTMAARAQGTGDKRPRRRRRFEAGEMVTPDERRRATEARAAHETYRPHQAETPKERGRKERRMRAAVEREGAKAAEGHGRFVERQRRRGVGPVDRGVLGFLGCREWNVTGVQCAATGCCSFGPCRVENERLRRVIGRDGQGEIVKGRGA